MFEKLIPLIMGFLGVIVGSFSSLVAIFIQNKYQAKRDKNKMITEVAVQEFKQALEMAKSQSRPTLIPSLGVYVYYNTKLIDLMDSGKLTKESFLAINKDVNDLCEKLNPVKDEDKDRRAKDEDIY